MKLTTIKIKPQLLEIWKDIENMNGKYQVSNRGKVRSLKFNNTNQKHIMKIGDNGFGYLCVNLSVNGKAKKYYVHRLVAQAFIPNPDNKPQINHKNEDKYDNRVCNLEWMTSKENINYGNRNKKSRETQINGVKSKPIYGVHIITGERIDFPSFAEARRNGYNPTHIYDSIIGNYTHHKNFKWFYLND